MKETGEQGGAAEVRKKGTEGGFALVEGLENVSLG